jgi:hypothetical protein
MAKDLSQPNMKLYLNCVKYHFYVSTAAHLRMLRRLHHRITRARIRLGSNESSCCHDITLDCSIVQRSTIELLKRDSATGHHDIRESPLATQETALHSTTDMQTANRYLN